VVFSHDQRRDRLLVEVRTLDHRYFSWLTGQGSLPNADCLPANAVQ
jgi:hypothetical protein